MRLFVIIPAYNEADSIQKTIEGLVSTKSRLAEQSVDLSIVVVNDGSRDATEEIALKTGCAKVVSHRRNRGLGAAVRTGLETAFKDGADIAVKFDADLQHNPFNIVDIVQPIIRNEADVVYGDRFENISYKMPIVRKWGNVAFRQLMRWLTGWPIRDSQPGIFACNRDYLAVFEIPGDYNYTQQVLLDAFLKGMRFDQVSVSFDRRESGKSFISLKYPFKVVPQIILVIAMTRPMAIFGTSGALFLLLATVIFLTQVSFWLAGYDDRPVQSVNLVLGAGLFGIQMLFFGVLAKLIVLSRLSRRP